MRKVVLTTLPTEGEYDNWQTPAFFHPTQVNKYMPLGILSLASNLPKGNDVVILDPSSYGWSIEQTIERIEREKPDILGISAITRRAYALGEILKKVTAPYKAVGGPHATHWSKQTLSNGADAVFAGPLADLEFRDAVVNTPRGVIRCHTGINEIRFPQRDLLDVEYYFPKASVLFKAENRLPMFSSIGCPNRCNYCSVQSKKLQFKRPETVVDEMQHLYSVGSRSIHVLDDNFNIKSRHLQGILDEMSERGFKTEWSGRGQTKMDLSLVKRMAHSGFKRIHVGIEALNDEILRFFNKNETVKDVETFCAEMNRHQIEILAYFISGSPLETDKYRAQLPQRIRELGVKYPYFNILFPEPKTAYYQQLLDDGTYKHDIWAEYMKNPTPYFEIPYPYGETQKQEVIAYTNELIEEFNPTRQPVSQPVSVVQT
ncbi:B12-binding domain-containing radical SAM protein [Planctomycetota bacterium]